MFKILGLNVNGFLYKFENGILEDYLADFDIICLSETKTQELPPNFSNSRIGDYKPLIKNKSPHAGGLYGGTHGILAFISPQLSATEIKFCKSDAVLWFIVSLGDWRLIVGATYIPCDGKDSKHHKKDVFGDIADDVIKLRTEYLSCPIVLVGDFNAHTAHLNDIINIDKSQVYTFGLDLLGPEAIESTEVLCSQPRSNSDKAPVNWNGRALIDMCKASNLLILNGRAGHDLGVGNSTFFSLDHDAQVHTGVSAIDYGIASQSLWPYISNFVVDTFDRLLSDRHAPIIISLEIPSHLTGQQERPSHHVSVSAQPSTQQGPSFVTNEWSQAVANKMATFFHNIDFTSLTNACSRAQHQADIDKVVKTFTDATIDIAVEAQACKKLNNRVKKKPISKATPFKPWFDDFCHVEKRKYFMLKNKLRRDKKHKAIANKCSKNFKKLLAQKRKEFYKTLNSKLKSMKNSNPREYWKILNASVEGKKTLEKVSLGVFFDHFRKLSCTPPNKPHGTSPAETPPPADLLSDAITLEEVTDCIESSKKGKAAGPDNVRIEYLSELPSEGLQFLCSLFNKILDSGIVPDDWTVGIILPLFKKKGAPEDPNNYRGITLLSCISKLFTAILNHRINKFMNENGLLGSEQAGFRSGQSTMDHVFVLHHILDYYRQKGKPIYCAFVDYSKAFDLVNRSALWEKLINQGISGKILTVIQNMYSSAKSCVRANGQLSDFFKCTAGVRQGENLSPILFAIYINDFQGFLSQKIEGLKSMNDLLSEFDVYAKLCVLLYADDTVILTESEKDLQCALNALSDYCKQWDLTVNLDKTNVVIFSKRRKAPKITFLYEGKVVKVAEDYTYLGVVFNFDGSFKKAIDHQKAVGQRALQALYSKIRILALDVDTSLELYQRYVMPILLYGSEIWAFDKTNVASLEIFNRRFLKELLGLYKFTPTCMVLGESGQPKLADLANTRQIGFWAKLASDNVARLSKHILPLITSLHDQPIQAGSNKCFTFKWLANIKQNLDAVGMSYAHMLPYPFHANQLISEFKLRLADSNLQTWNQSVWENELCSNYRMYKSAPNLSIYLLMLPSRQRTSLCRFRCRSHRLPVCARRFNKEAPESSMRCTLCNSNDVGDEFHYIFVCNAFKAERARFIPSKFLKGPNALKYTELFESQDVQILADLAKFSALIMDHFVPKKSPDVEFLRPMHVTRAGRVSKPPLRFMAT